MRPLPSSLRARSTGRVAAGGLVAVLLLAGCGGTDDTSADPAEPAPTPSASSSSTDDSPSAEPSDDADPDDEATDDAPDGTEIDMTLQDGQVTPNGERVEAAVGEPITVNIDADAAGELHVHSTPEASFDFEPGESEFTFTVDSPGVVEVELHDPALVVVQLEVR